LLERLREAAALLEHQEANRFQVAAYRNAADTVESLAQDVSLIFRTEGFQGLTALPRIGTQIGGAIAEMIRTGQWTQLERLRGSLEPESLLGKVPGIGANLARRILDELHIDTLEGLETAVYDGRLASLPGFGARRVAMVRAGLAEMLGQSDSTPEGQRTVVTETQSPLKGKRVVRGREEESIDHYGTLWSQPPNVA